MTSDLQCLRRAPDLQCRKDVVGADHRQHSAGQTILWSKPQGGYGWSKLKTLKKPQMTWSIFNLVSKRIQ